MKNHPIITSIEVGSKFRYLWLKYVVGVSLGVHCARCLKGEYSQHINKDLKQSRDFSLDEAPALAYYLCGVASPYSWEKNFHLAFRYKKGSRIRIAEHGISVKIEDAERIDILPVDLDKINSPHKDNKRYVTCRNWQFAHQFKELFLKETPPLFP